MSFSFKIHSVECLHCTSSFDGSEKLFGTVTINLVDYPKPRLGVWWFPNHVVQKVDVRYQRRCSAVKNIKITQVHVVLKERGYLVGAPAARHPSQLAVGGGDQTIMESLRQSIRIAVVIYVITYQTESIWLLCSKVIMSQKGIHDKASWFLLRVWLIWLLPLVPCKR